MLEEVRWSSDDGFVMVAKELGARGSALEQ